MSHGIGSLVVVDAGSEAMLDLVLGVNYTLRLFTNDVTAGLTPAQIDALVAGDFTEATFTGYASKALTGGSWTTTQGNPSTGTYAAQAFAVTVTGTAQNVWGYYITRTSDGALQWFEQFSAPVVMEFAADTLNITPRITLDDAEGYAVEPGTITAYGAATAPTGWLLCDGTAVSRSTYADLFAVIGTTYGVGDGSSTFNVPDLQQRFPLGKAAAGTGATLGETGGAVDHVHNLDVAGAGAKVLMTTTDPEIRVARVTGLTSWSATHADSTGSVASDTSASTTGVGLAGDTDTENPPYLALNFIVKV